MQGIARGVRDGSELDGIHLLWYGELTWGYSPRGFTIYRRRARRLAKLACHRIDGAELTALHRDFVLEIPGALVRWRPSECPRLAETLPSEHVGDIEIDRERLGGKACDALDAALREWRNESARRHKTAAVERQRAQRAEASLRAAAKRAVARRATSRSPCQRYRFDLANPQPYVRLTMGAPAMLVIALRGSKAVRAELVPGEATSSFELYAPGITRLIVYTAGTRFIELCVPDSSEGEDRDWARADVLVENLQLPIRDLNSEVTDSQQELDLARSRTLQTALSEQDFQTLAEYLRHLAQASTRPPSECVLLEPDSEGGGMQEFSLLALALLPQLDGDGRRMLGLAHRDAHQLVAGQSYDYRITGYFPEIDVKDRILSFRLAPGGTVVPQSFYLDDVRIRLPAPTTVDHRPRRRSSESGYVARRGIRLRLALQPSVRLEFPEAIDEVTLELSRERSEALHIRAVGAAFLGLTTYVEERTVEVNERVTLNFSDPIDRLELRGDVFFHGLRIHGVTGDARDPEALVPVHLDVLGVHYVDSPRPPPPDELAVENLQAFLVPTEPDVAAGGPPHRLGLRLRWRQAIEGGAPLWPSDEDFAQPVGATAFAVERRRIDEPSSWHGVGVKSIFGARATKDGVRRLTPDQDLIEYFSTKAQGSAPDDFFTFDDVLDPPDSDAGAPPGSLWQYRIASIDAIGRQSDTWTISPVVRLEKRVPPPPPQPPETGASSEGVQLRGVQARLVQRSDPDISAAEKQAVLGESHDSAIVVRWSYSAELRAQDPHVRQFRVYFRERPGSDLTGSITSIDSDGPHWRCLLDWERPVGIDALAGLRLRSGGHSFRIEQHDAGATGVVTRLRKLALHPSESPIVGAVELLVDTQGGEGRPILFDERVSVVPFDPQSTQYESVIFDRIAVDEHTPRQTVWAGVSAADDQSYVPDSIPSSSPNGGLAGNESTIVTVAASARYHGRPTYVAPAPLPTVPERVTSEPEGGLVALTLPLAELVPADAALSSSDRVQLERLELSALSQRLRATDDGGFAVDLPDGSSAPWILPNASDQATLRGELETGEPARVANRFLLAMLAQHPDLGKLFTPAGEPRPFGNISDTVPGQAERYAYRIRRVDAAGNVSAQAALLTEVVRVPSLAQLGAPTVDIGATQDDHLRVTLSARAAFELRWLAVFYHATSLGSQQDEPEQAELIRLKNRRDLLPQGGYRLRYGDLYIDPHPVEVQVPDIADGLATVSFCKPVGYAKRLRVWAIALTRDGLPSLVAGPQVATTARPPITAPIPEIVRTGSVALISWSGMADDIEIRVESDGGTNSWRPVTAWLGPGVTEVNRPVTDPAERFRLEARATDGRRHVSAAVQVPGE